MPTSPIHGVLGHLRRAARPGDDTAMTDGQLLGEFVARRDEAAFARLVQRHGPMVFGLCQRVLRHRQDTEDAFQATFIVLARKAASVQPSERLGGWLYGVAYRTALEARRLAARRRDRERQVEDMPHPAFEPEELWQDLRPVLDEELSRLSDRHRLPIVLCDLEGRTRKEVARQLGVPEGTLSNRLAAARQTLAKRLTRRGLALSGSAVGVALSNGGASAGVPASLVSATVHAAVGVAATTVVSAEVAALTKGVLASMFLTKLKLVVAVLFLVGLLGAGVGTALLSSPVGAEEPPRETPPSLPKVAPAQRGDRKPAIVERGSVKAALVTDLACGLKASNIRWVQEDGAIVKKGDKLVVLDDAGLRDQFREQKVAYDKAVTAKIAADATLARIRKEIQLDVREGEVEVKLAKLRLVKSAGTDRVDKEILELKVEQAQIKLERVKLRGQAREARAESDVKARAAALDKQMARQRDLEAQMARCVLLAPHDGIAVHYVSEPTRPLVAAGEPVSEGQKLVSVHGTDRFLVITQVHEAHVSRVRAGQPVSVRIDAFPDRVFAGKVKSVAKLPSQQKWLTANVKVYPVEVELTDHPPGVKPGMTSEIRIDTEKAKPD